MKTPLALGLLISLFSLPALAAQTLVCKPLQTYPGEYRLVIDQNKSTASIYSIDNSSKNPQWELEFKNAKVMIASDGGPTTISGSDDKPVDWSKTKGCYVFKKPGLYFTLRGRAGRYSGSFRQLPNIATKPNTTCSIPRPMVPPSVSIDCEEVKNTPAK